MKFKKTILFSITSERIKYLGINFKKQMPDLYTANYNTLLEEILKDLNNGKISHDNGVEESILLRWQYSPNWSTGPLQFLSKSQVTSLQKLTSLS